MGGGPEHFVRNGVEQLLRDCGYEVHLDSIEASSSFRAEIKTAFELYRVLAQRVSSAYKDGMFPLVLSGNCNSSLGTIAGVSSDQLGIVWFDGHGDFNTPETSESGFLDGMALATAAGLCWKKMAASIPNFSPISARNILHVGGRDCSPEEKVLFKRCGGTVVNAETIKRSGVSAALLPALDELRSRISRIYLHFDLDALDPERAPANEFAPPGGLTVSQIQEAIREVGERFTICACGIASYDPQYDNNDEVLRAGVAIMKSVLEGVMSRRA